MVLVREDGTMANVHHEDPLLNVVAPPPPTRHAAVVTSRRVRRNGTTASSSSRRIDRNRPIEVLAVLLAYVIIVHYAMKFLSFVLLPPDVEDASSLAKEGSPGFGLRRGSSMAGGGNGMRGARAWDASSTAWAFSIARRGRGGGWRAFSSRHVDVVRYDRCSNDNIGLLTLSSPSSSRDDEAVVVVNAKGKSKEVNDDDAVIIVDTSVIERRDDVVDGGIIANATMSMTTSAKMVERIRDRIPVLSYQDEYVIISKPSGMTMHHDAGSHRGRRGRWGRSKSPVLQTAIQRQLGRRPYLVHRLDHRTSGACLLGFTSSAASELHGRLRDVNSKKLYVALVRGDLRERFKTAATGRCVVADVSDVGANDTNDDADDGGITCRPGRIPDVMAGRGVGKQPEEGTTYTDNDEYHGRITVNLPIKVKMVGDIEVMKDASTDFYFLSSMTAADDDEDGDGSNEDETRSSSTTRYVNKSLTLLMCHPRTGRTHQIRRHLRKGLMSPVIGDVEHGDSRVNRHWRETIGLDRLGLHCWYLELPPPSSYSSSLSSSSSSSDDNRGAIACMAPLTLDFARALRHDRLESLWAEALCVEPRLGMEPYDERGGTFGRNYRKR